MLGCIAGSTFGEAHIGRVAILSGLLAALVAAGGCATDAPVPGAAPAADSGTVAFSSAGGLQRSADGRSFTTAASVTISGELRFPAGSGPFPAVVLAHGCNGNRNVERAWGPTLRSWGYATFVIDSFGERGIKEVCTGAQRLVPLQRVPDAYGALRLLAAHPRIDPRRVALMGFSHGGALSMLAATAWARETYARDGLPSFRAFFPFYPNCNAVYPERNRLSAPVRIHTGEADDWTPARPCAELVRSLRAAGQDVAIDVYPGAHHAFDQAGASTYLPNVNNGANCYAQMRSILGHVVPASIANCVTKGANIGGSPSATEQARKNIRAQLDELLK